MFLLLSLKIHFVTGKLKLIVHTQQEQLKVQSNHTILRDRPFNLKGGLWFFVSFRIIFLDNMRVRMFIFCRAEFNIRLYDKNSESDYFFFPPPKSEYFFQQHWESE